MPRASSSGISSLLMPPGAARCSCTIWACLTVSAPPTYSVRMAVIRLTLTLPSIPPQPDTWVDWDPSAGTVTGPAAQEFLSYPTRIEKGTRTLTQHTMARDADLRHRFSKEPLKNYSDMSVLVRDAGYRLPDILKPHFPQAPKEQLDQLRAIEASHDPEGSGISCLI
ncbi:MAG: hypothetical protein OXU61_09915 [Gammaproteobacteria bacterium]|nr:hypothetical protein [Gammaproteobacteria bacterium]